MISWTTADRFGVRWSGPAAPTLSHAGGDHAIDAEVTARDVISLFELEKVAGAAAAWPQISRSTTPLLVSSAWNCTWASRIVAPGGTSIPRNRMPIVWFGLLVPSSANSRSLLERDMLHERRSSASSLPDTTRISCVSVCAGAPIGKTRRSGNAPTAANRTNHGLFNIMSNQAEARCDRIRSISGCRIKFHIRLFPHHHDSMIGNVKFVVVTRVGDTDFNCLPAYPWHSVRGGICSQYVPYEGVTVMRFKVASRVRGLSDEGVSRGLRYGGAVPRGAAPAALAGRLRLPLLRPSRALRAGGARALSMQPVQEADIAHGGHDLPRDQAAADALVRSHSPDRDGEERHLVGGTRPPSRGPSSRRPGP